MVQSPHLPQKNGLSYIQEYANKGSDKIAIHRRAFDNLKEMEKGIDQIRDNNAEPGFIIETNDFSSSKNPSLSKYPICTQP